ncbi:MAG: serine/threonine protein kinase [Phycisphaerae bacterium]|nr:serine/threonine protein kinase [Gemmatimonadaceae bacterium]
MPDRYLGRVIGKYRVTRLIGAGAFAWVYEAVDLDLQVPVALKVLRPEFAGQPAAEARFRREATTAARLRHPNIVFIRDVGEAEGTVFVAMDLLPLSLARRLEVLPRLPEAEVVRFALDVAAALAIAHADGLVHRDIKPDNVMLGSNGEAIVADFGLADAFTSETNKQGANVFGDADAGKVMGTPHYFSPEQARGLDLDGRTDLYSLGVMCYRAATGVLPFEGDDFYSVARQHVENTPVPPRMLVPELTEAFEAIVLRLLAKQPDLRFASATLLADALLMLPTAPVSRSVGLVPVGASVTQIAYPYVHTAVVPRSRGWPRKVATGVVGIAVTASVALLAMPSLAGLRNTMRPDSSAAAVPPPPVDTTRVAATDSLTLKSDSATTPLLTVKAPPVRPITSNRAPAAITRVHVVLTAPDSAVISVNDQPVGRGSWEVDLPTGRPQHFRARLEPTLPGCRSAQQDTSITFNGVAQATVELDVINCAVFLLTIRSTDADFILRGRDFQFEKIGRYLGTTQPIVLRHGLYELQVRSDRCADYSDTLTIGRKGATGSDTVTRDIKQICGESTGGNLRERLKRQ